MKAVKGNKVYTIDEAQKKRYQDAGYDILGDSREAIAYGRGKTVPYEEYEAIRKELEEQKGAAGAEENGDAVDILRCFAHEHGIDLGKASTMAGIVKKIREHPGQVPGEGE